MNINGNIDNGSVGGVGVGSLLLCLLCRSVELVILVAFPMLISSELMMGTIVTTRRRMPMVTMKMIMMMMTGIEIIMTMIQEKTTP